MRTRKIINKIFIAAGTVFIILTLNFLLVYYMPGDAIVHILGEEEYYQYQTKNPEYLEELREKYGLNDSLAEQYGKYIKNSLSMDFGFSYVKVHDVKGLIVPRLFWTLLLALPATVLAAVMGGWLGILSGFKPGGRTDRILTPVFLFLNTIPSNCLCILMISFFSFKLGWFPISGMSSGGLSGLKKVMDILWHAMLPLSVLTCYKVSANYIHMKSYVMEIRGEEYILTALSKGLSDKKIIRRHLLKNAMLPYVTNVLMQFGSVLSGSLMVEVAFSWKGIGTLMQSSLETKDYPTLQMCFLLTGVCVVICNLAADIFQIIMDPRLKECIKDGT